jgi:glycine/D-amino acid oxidase-like deaminating enzyme/nitrite reductase/ring-hydroxylating ferredoxin subunit
MNDFNSAGTMPIWKDATTVHRHPQQDTQVSVDVCIIGAGITGLTAADLLKRAGKTVAVIDLGHVGNGETGHTSAHLTEVFDLDYRDLIANFGEVGARLAAQSVREAIEHIEETSSLYDLKCDFARVPGYQFTENENELEELRRESIAASRIGVLNQVVSEAPVPFKIAGAIRFDNQAQFNPLAYVEGLAKRVPGNGSHLFEDTRMLEVEEGEPCRVITDRSTIIADDVIVAANVPSLNRFFLHTKIAAYRTYAVAARVTDTFSNQNLFGQSLFWDIASPYHYIRSVQLNGVPHLIVGGEDHKTGQGIHTGAHYSNLEEWIGKHFHLETITHRWSGQIIESVDGLPFIGRNTMSRHVYVATGFSGTGLTFGTVAARLISDLIVNLPNPYVELYDAARVKPWSGIRNFLSENIDFPSHLISDRFSGTQKTDADGLKENEGAIVRVGAKKVAAFRDPEGRLHMMSPVCPHLGCYVNWNEAEKSWDCPCHGSRFAPTGRLLNGPALTDLAVETFDENVPLTPERYEKPVLSVDPFNPMLTTFMCPCKV